MLKRLLTLLMIGGVTAWGQAQKDAPANADTTGKVDKAAAYYHFALACMYANTLGPGNADKARENLKAAREADPQAPRSLPLRIPPVLAYRPRPITQPAPPAPRR